MRKLSISYDHLVKHVYICHDVICKVKGKLPLSISYSEILALVVSTELCEYLDSSAFLNLYIW